MFFLTWNHFKQDNKTLHKRLGIERGAEVNLHFTDGFFISPDDYVNRRSHYQKVLLERSIIDVFRTRYPKIFRNVEDFYRIVGGFDRLDYQKLQLGAKLSYFFAAAYYAYSCGLKEMTNIKPLYKETYRQQIEKRLRHLLVKFAELASHRGARINTFSLFQFALSIIKEAAPRVSFPAECSRVTAFVRSPKYYPYGLLVGQAFEEEVQDIFSKMETQNEHYLAKMVHSQVRENGVLIPLDEDKDFKKVADKKGGDLSVPDYMFVSDRRIMPIDLKVNLEFAKDHQVEAANLHKLFEQLEDKARTIFAGMTVEGHFLEPPKQEAQEKAAEKKADTPMEVLKNKGVPGKDIGAVAQLWQKGRPIDQDALRAAGCRHSNLGMIVNIFNGMLKKR